MTYEFAKYPDGTLGGCIICHNKSKIPERELNIICEDISLHYFQIVEKWKTIHSGNIRFYC